MKTTKAKKVTAKTTAKPLVLGRYREGTAIAKVASLLADGKKHKYGEISKKVRGVKDLKYRIQRLRIHGKKLRGKGWVVTRDKDIFQMKVAKGVAKPKKAAPKKVAAKKVTPTTTAVAA